MYACVCSCGYCGQFIVAFANWRWNLFALFDLDAFLTLCGAFCRFSLASVLLFWYFFFFSYSSCVFSYFWFFGICIYFMHVVRVFVKKPQMRRIFHFCAVFCCFSRCSRKTRFSSHLDALVSVQQPQQTLQVSSWIIIFSCSHSTHMFSTREQKTLNPPTKANIEWKMGIKKFFKWSLGNKPEWDSNAIESFIAFIFKASECILNIVIPRVSLRVL